MDRGVLMEEEVRSVDRQISVHLIRGDLMVSLDAVLSAGIHQDRGTDDVGLQEDRRVLDGAVHVGLCCEVYDDVRLLLLEELVYALSVADVELHKAEVLFVHHRSKGRKIPRIGQGIQADDSVLRVFLELVEDEVASDESGTAGHNDGHVLSLSGHAGLIRLFGTVFPGSLPGRPGAAFSQFTLLKVFFLRAAKQGAAAPTGASYRVT